MKAAEEAWIYELPRVGRTTLSQQVALHLLALVLKGDLMPGQELPPERELAAVLGVGRPAVREALSALGILGVVVLKPGHQARISHSDAEMLVRPFRVFAALENLDIHALFDVREILEAGIAGLAAERMTDEEIDELRATVEDLSRATGDSARFLKLDEEFHAALVRGCRNPLLSGVMAPIGALGHLYRQVACLFPTFNDQMLMDHQAIVAAIAVRDAEGSRQAMRAHIRNVAGITELAEARGLGRLDLTESEGGLSRAELLDAWLTLEQVAGANRSDGKGLQEEPAMRGGSRCE